MDQLIEEWLEDQCSRKKDPVWDRKYKHFDSPSSREDYRLGGKYHNKLLELETLAQHKYWPFIRRDKFSIRYNKKNPDIQQRRTKKNRSIMYASHLDAAIFSFHAYILRCLYEQRIAGTPMAESVIAYRRIPKTATSTKNKSNIDFTKDAYQFIRTCDDSVVLCLDVKGFFDNMDHSLIIKSVNDFLPAPDLQERFRLVIKPLTKYRYVFRDDVKKVFTSSATWVNPYIYNKYIKDTKLLHRNKRKGKGIPQGAPMSDILANIYLYSFDLSVLKQLSSRRNTYYRRYSDDILIVVPRKDASNIYEFVCREIKKVGLEISRNKTEAFFVDRQTGTIKDVTKKFYPQYTKNKEFIQYLGFTFNLQNIYLRSQNPAKTYRRVKGYLKKIKRKNNGQSRAYSNKLSFNRYQRWAADSINERSLSRQVKKIHRNIKKLAKEKH